MSDDPLRRLLFSESGGEPPAPRSSDPVVGTEVDGLRLEAVLGRGGMGVVYRAREARTGRAVALKLAPAAAAQDDRAAERARREALALAALDHPGILEVHAVGDLEGRPYLVCELIEGARHLDELAPELPLRRRIELVRDAARALGHAHARGVVHRDVKGANLLVDASGRLRVADFGLARLVDLERLTVSGALVGTPAYLAPEQLGVDEAWEVGPATDVWGLGLVLYEALTGARPFDGETLAALAGQIAATDPPPPSERGEAPAVLDGVVARALAKAPQDRYPDGEVLAQVLDRYLAGRLRRPARRGVALVVLLALSVFALGLARELWLRRGARAELGQVAAWEATWREAWRAGLGDPDALPDAERLARELAAARGALARARDPEAEALVARLEAARRLRVGGAPPEGSAPEVRVAAALLLDQAGETQAARDLARELARQAPALGGLLALELEARRRPLRFLELLGTTPLDGPQRELARRRLEGAVEGACREALRRPAPGVGARVEAALAGLPAEVRDATALARARGRALDAEAAVWGRAATGDAPDLTREVLAAVAGGPGDARSGGPTESALLHGMLRVLGRLPLQGPLPDERLLEGVAFWEPLAGLDLPCPGALVEAIWRRALDRFRRVPFPALRVVLRGGVRLDDDFVFNALRHALEDPSAEAALAAGDPRSRLVRFCRMTQALPREWRIAGQADADVLAAAREVLAPERVDDLAPCYLAQVRLLIAYLLTRQGEDQGSPAACAQALEQLELAWPALWVGRLSGLAGQLGASAADGIGESARGDAWIARAVAALEAARSERPPAVGRPPVRVEPLADLRLLQALRAWRADDVAQARALAELGWRESDALDPWRRTGVRARAGRRFLDAGALDLAEATVAPVADREGFGHSALLAQVAVEVALGSQPELAARRLALALDVRPDDPELRALEARRAR
ncbi:MAG: protein kinase [Planctomycetota bacterium]